ncbi:hypothetical protein SK128_002091 [Halocaridina rubra]|uniref:G-protein coupled receptors family 1 profile domain-containing protein n=1 Tax=Halocaridina rubra TaxID=373956 RepID=A0AAN9A5A6_HALRR
MITINRYIMIAHFSVYKLVYRKVFIAIMIAFCWIFAFVMLLPTLLNKWGRFGFDKKLQTCSIIDEDNKAPKQVLFGLGFCVPAVIIVICYSLIFFVIHRSEKRMRHHSSRGMNGSHTTGGGSALQGHSRSLAKVEREARRKRNEWRITKMVLIIFVAFLITYLPITLVKNLDKKVSYPGLHVLGYVLIYISSCINPVIYVIMNRQYRQAYKTVLLCKRPRLPSLTSSYTGSKRENACHENLGFYYNSYMNEGSLRCMKNDKSYSGTNTSPQEIIGSSKHESIYPRRSFNVAYQHRKPNRISFQGFYTPDTQSVDTLSIDMEHLTTVECQNCQKYNGLSERKICSNCHNLSREQQNARVNYQNLSREQQNLRKMQKPSCTDCRKLGRKQQFSCVDCQNLNREQHTACVNSHDSSRKQQISCVQCQNISRIWQISCANCRNAGKNQQTSFPESQFQVREKKNFLGKNIMTQHYKKRMKVVSMQEERCHWSADELECGHDEFLDHLLHVESHSYPNLTSNESRSFKSKSVYHDYQNYNSGGGNCVISDPVSKNGAAHLLNPVDNISYRRRTRSFTPSSVSKFQKIPMKVTDGELNDKSFERESTFLQPSSKPDTCKDTKQDSMISDAASREVCEPFKVMSTNLSATSDTHNWTHVKQDSRLSEVPGQRRDMSVQTKQSKSTNDKKEKYVNSDKT